MTTTRGGRRQPGRGAEPVALHEKQHRAAVLGDGKVFPIVETLGRRVLREIDPLSAEGRSLLDAGKVTLWIDDGARAEAAPIQKILDELQSAVRQRRDVYPEIPRWTAHHDQLLKSIRRMKRTLKPRH